MIYSFEPIYDQNSKVMILGSMASIKSLEYGFFYMHPQNKFWRILTKICGYAEVPKTHALKAQMLLENRIALADIYISCEREGSLDSKIKQGTVRDLAPILEVADIRKFFCNGKKSYETTTKAYPELKAVYLPSTSPANNGNFDEAAWLKIAEYLI